MSTFVDIILRRFCMNRKGGTGESGWGHPQGDMPIVARWHAHGSCCDWNAMVDTGWSNSCLGHTNVVRKYYLHLAGFISGSEGNLGSQRVFAGWECWPVEGLLLGAGWKSDYVTLISHCHKWHRSTNGHQIRPQAGQDNSACHFR